jgi:hypothetical protein
MSPFRATMMATGASVTFLGISAMLLFTPAHAEEKLAKPSQPSLIVTPPSTDSARTLAYKCAQQEVDAMYEVQRILVGLGLDLNRVVDDVRDSKAKELVQQYVRREPSATKVIDFLLTETGVSMVAFMAEGLVRGLDDIERIDRLISIAENRRNATLREIDRRRAVLGETLRRSVQEIEDGEFEEIETTPAQGKNAA